MSESGITKETLQKAFDKISKRIEKNANEPDRYWTRCLNCGRLVLAIAYLKVEKCPICEDFKKDNTK